jgi:hypothetical protein
VAVPPFLCHGLLVFQKIAPLVMTSVAAAVEYAAQKKVAAKSNERILAPF